MLPMRGLDICQVVQVPEPSTVVHFPRGSLIWISDSATFLRILLEFHQRSCQVVILDLWMVFLGKGLETKNLGPKWRPEVRDDSPSRFLPVFFQPKGYNLRGIPFSKTIHDWKGTEQLHQFLLRLLHFTGYYLEFDVT